MTQGTNLGQIVNLPFGTEYVDALNNLNRAFDALAATIVVKDVTILTPPVSPSADDAYLIPTGSTPTGSWASQAGTIAVWRPYVTTGVDNVADPKWDFYPLKEGWVIKDINSKILYQVQADTSIGGYLFADVRVTGVNGFRIDFNDTNYLQLVKKNPAGILNDGYAIDTTNSPDAPRFSIITPYIQEHWDNGDPSTKKVVGLRKQNWDGNYHSTMGLISFQQDVIVADTIIDVMPDLTPLISNHIVIVADAILVPIEQILATELTDGEVASIVFGADLSVGAEVKLVHDGVNIILAGAVDYSFTNANQKICLQLRQGIAIELWRNNL